MATFDQLSAEQRAIIELVLKQQQSYDDLSGMLNMPTSRVRELGRDALVHLSPVSAAAVDGDWRDQLGDYLLNQQSGPESTATRGHLRRSEASRAWARSVLDSLEQFYDADNIPEIPSGDGAAAEPRRRRRRGRAPAAPSEDEDGTVDAPPRTTRRLSPEAQRILRNRRLLGAGALAVAVLFAILVWPIGVLGGDDADKADKAKAESEEARIEGQIVLAPLDATPNSRIAGLAVIALQGGARKLIVQAQLPRVRNREAYEVWLYNSRSNARSLGAQVTDREGGFQGAGTLPRDYREFTFIDISREPVNQDGKHSGDSVLRGRIADIRPPASTGGQTTAPSNR
jgi:Anti-sigma-K factor rskA/Sigma-70, region 4